MQILTSIRRITSSQSYASTHKTDLAVLEKKIKNITWETYFSHTDVIQYQQTKYAKWHTSTILLVNDTKLCRKLWKINQMPEKCEKCSQFNLNFGVHPAYSMLCHWFLHRVQEKVRQNVFCNIFYKTWTILIKVGTRYPEYSCHKVL